MRRTLLSIVLALTLTSVNANAQTIDDLKHSLALQQIVIDRLQATINAKLGPQNVAGFIDWIAPGPAGSFLIVGWALECGKRQPTAQLMIDGVLAKDIYAVNYLRTDVTAVYSPYCDPRGGLLPELGATALVDLSNYAPGPHTIAFRLRALNGYEVTSNVVTLIK